MQYQVEVDFDGVPAPLPLNTVANLTTEHGIAFDYSAVKKPVPAGIAVICMPTPACRTAITGWRRWPTLPPGSNWIFCF
ncbi:hypothetical protein MBH78_11120 [Oceanimonas sp. NS1]|nr:hypothetical protein [Oceanimonas sp. NS1]